MRTFICFHCKDEKQTNTPPCIHYDDDEMDDNGEASLCDTCLKEAQELAISKGLENKVSKKFFICQSKID